MAAEQLPDAVREFTDHLRDLLARLDRYAGWCLVFWQRDPDGMRACLEGREPPPWDVVESLLQDLAAAHGPAVAEAEAPRARLLYAEATTAFDGRPGARQALSDRLDVMLREQRYAADRRAELTRRLASAAGREEADALGNDLAWAEDDHRRAAARCAELTARMAALDRRTRTNTAPTDRYASCPTGTAARSDAAPHAGPGSSGGPAHPAGPASPGGPAHPAGPGSPGGPAHLAGPGSPGGPAHLAGPTSPGGSSHPAGPASPGGPAHPAGPTSPGGSSHPAGPTSPGGPAHPAGPGSPGGPAHPAGAASPGGPAPLGPATPSRSGPAPQQHGNWDSDRTRQGRPTPAGPGPRQHANPAPGPGRRPTPAPGPQQHVGPAADAAQPGYRPIPAPGPQRHTGPAPDATGHGDRSAPGPAPRGRRPEPSVEAEHSRPAPPRSRQEQYPAPEPVPPELRAAQQHVPPAPPADGNPPAPPRKRRRGGARFAGVEDGGEAPVVAPAAAVPELPVAASVSRGARFAGAAADEAEQAGPPAGERAGVEDLRQAGHLVRTLVRLRREGRAGEAHAVLNDAAYWPAVRFPLLADEMERAGLGADWATLLWEAAASLPAERLVAAADALTEAGRAEDGEQILRQGVVRPADEIGQAALALAEGSRHRELRALLDACVRMRTPQDAARTAAPDPRRLVPLLLTAARGVSEERHWDVLHALRVAGLAA
ncbi:hypothetical protein [Streptomyces tendae]|uniref:UL36 very large tegument protein n=1 Tax=Streptomyces tendae TaxID=1932 RepID=A0ABX5ZQV1_STRTE|nr:hypothetical protein [Streptomyces tendae]QER86783.1 hypothetical protein F3L20_13510 [Streptomyces tendae]